MSASMVLQYVTCLTRQRAMSIRNLTITLHNPLTHCKHPLMEKNRFQMSDFAPCHLRHKSHLLAMNISNLMWFDMNSGFYPKTDEKSILKSYYTVSSGNSLAKFWENLFSHFQGTFEDWTVGCTETSVRNYHYSLRDNALQHSSLTWFSMSH